MRWVGRLLARGTEPGRLHRMATLSKLTLIIQANQTVLRRKVPQQRLYHSRRMIYNGRHLVRAIIKYALSYHITHPLRRLEVDKLKHQIHYTATKITTTYTITSYIRQYSVTIQNMISFQILTCTYNQLETNRSNTLIIPSLLHPNPNTSLNAKRQMTIEPKLLHFRPAASHILPRSWRDRVARLGVPRECER